MSETPSHLNIPESPAGDSPEAQISSQVEALTEESTTEVQDSMPSNSVVSEETSEEAQEESEEGEDESEGDAAEEESEEESEESEETEEHETEEEEPGLDESATAPAAAGVAGVPALTPTAEDLAAFSDSVPVGVVVAWYGDAGAVPRGWALCDGQTVNGFSTPDLRGLFLRGADAKDPAKTVGGEDHVGRHQHTVTVPNLAVQVDHSRASGEISGHVGRPGDGGWPNQPGFEGAFLGYVRGGWLTHDHSARVHGETLETNEVPPQDNRPKFFSMNFIIKIKN